MRRSTPKDCTVLIAQTGRSPLTLSVRVGPTLALISVILITPLVILGSTIYSLQQKNSALKNQNQQLSESADEVMQELDQLDSEIQDLQERAGILDQSIAAPDADRDRSRGGVSKQVAAEDLLAIAKATLPNLNSRLQSEVKPALHETLEEEAARLAARPKARPVKADLPISSRFGLRSNPFGRGYEVHNGIDFPGPVGTPIYATAPGVVEKAEYQRGYGYHIVIDHGYGYRTLYAHLSEMAVAQGESIAANQTIGYLGSTGRSTGPHLHYSVYRHGKAVDPTQYLTSPFNHD